MFVLVAYHRMKKLYSWQDVAKRTEIVYDRAMKCSNRSLLERLSRYPYLLIKIDVFLLESNEDIMMMVGRFLSCGAWAGKVLCMVMIIDYLLWRLLQVRIYILSLRNISKICNDNLIM